MKIAEGKMQSEIILDEGKDGRWIPIASVVGLNV